ncbi:Uncharacterized protein TCM_034576 [Theobroma cacao]|uniref:Uncharacterized protein n=1 Tax=Theobroma cacao TaxID=3641 RepID=A0A061FE00_THECC|nr:Uncharacterized protein TCM_034576 [Theobroma cacao]
MKMLEFGTLIQSVGRVVNEWTMSATRPGVKVVGPVKQASLNCKPASMSESTRDKAEMDIVLKAILHSEIFIDLALLL